MSIPPILHEVGRAKAAKLRATGEGAGSATWWLGLRTDSAARSADRAALNLSVVTITGYFIPPWRSSPISSVEKPKYKAVISAHARTGRGADAPCTAPRPTEGGVVCGDGRMLIRGATRDTSHQTLYLDVHGVQALCARSGEKTEKRCSPPSGQTDLDLAAALAISSVNSCQEKGRSFETPATETFPLSGASATLQHVGYGGLAAHAL